MKRFAGTASLLVLTAGLAVGSAQVDSKRAQTDASADTDPNSAFWREAAPILAERDGSGNLVPGHRTEIRSRWTGRCWSCESAGRCPLSVPTESEAVQRRAGRRHRIRLLGP